LEAEKAALLTEDTAAAAATAMLHAVWETMTDREPLAMELLYAARRAAEDAAVFELARVSDDEIAVKGMLL
jgi:hypothetical protein